MYNRSNLESLRLRRYKLVFSAFLLGAASLAAHLFFLQFHVPTRELYAGKVAERWHSYECPQARRGDIYYRDGTLLAGTRKVAKVIIEPQLIERLPETAATLAQYLGRPPEDIETEIAGYTRRGMELARGVDLGTALQIDRAGMRGVYTRYYYERVYPHGAYCAGPVTGYAGHEPHQRLGLEYACDSVLSGEDGKVIYRKDATRQRLPGSVLFEKERRDGSPLYTTLHHSIQTICEEEMRAAIERNSAEWGCILVLDPRSGEVLGAGTHPTFDPNEYVAGNLGEERNVLVHNAIEPGSTVKPLLAAYALDRQWLSPAHKYVCNRHYRVGKYSIREAEASHWIGGNGGVGIDRILISSSNVGMAQVALQLGQDHVREAYEALGFWAKTGIELPGESRGLRPCNWQKKGDAWPKISLATTGYGQGMSVTPLQLAAAYCALANGGYRVRPTLLLRDDEELTQEPAEPEIPEGEIVIAGFAGGVGATWQSRRGQVVGQAAVPVKNSQSAGRVSSPSNPDRHGGLSHPSSHHTLGEQGRIRVLSPETCTQVTQWLERVVTEGTGKSAKLERYRAAGKTGTAQIPGKSGGYASGAYVASFVGYFPVEEPRYLVLVMFSRPRGGYYGGVVAAPVFKKVGDRISYIDELALRGAEY